MSDFLEAPKTSTLQQNTQSTHLTQSSLPVCSTQDPVPVAVNTQYHTPLTFVSTQGQVVHHTPVPHAYMHSIMPSQVHPQAPFASSTPSRLGKAPESSEVHDLEDSNNDFEGMIVSKTNTSKSLSKRKAKPLELKQDDKRQKQTVTEASKEVGKKGKRGGRKAGVQIYVERDMRHLVDIVADVEPTGRNGWLDVETRYNIYARANGRTERMEKALRKKYKEVCTKVDLLFVILLIAMADC